MFFDVVDMTATYIQYLTLLLKLSPEALPSFYIGPVEFFRYALLDTAHNIKEVQRYINPLRVELPEWLPLDIRLQYVCVAIIGPLALSTLGLLLVYGKPAYAWFLCLLSTLFMFLFGFILLDNGAALSAGVSELPPRSTLGILSGVGLPLFVLLLAVGLLSIGRARLRRLRWDAVELERLIDEERQRQESRHITQQVVDRQGINLVDVAAERVHAKRREYLIAHLDIEDVLWQSLLVLVLLVGSLVLLGAIPIRAIDSMQRSVVFRVLGGIMTVFFVAATLYWIMSMFSKGRRYLYACSGALYLHALSLVMMLASFLYISVVTNFIAIIYCRPLTCEAGSKMPHPASLFPRVGDTKSGNDTGDILNGSPVGCLPCSFHNFTQKCPTAFRHSICAEPQRQSRLVYDLRVPCERMDSFYMASGILIFTFYILFLPYLQLYIAQYGVRVLQDVYPLERRYHDVFTSEELYFQKVLSSSNSAAFAYRAYKPQFRFYRLSFLLQKIVLGIVGCVMQRGQQQQTAWVGMLFFMAVPLIALGCAVYLQPFSRPTEAVYFPALQAMVALCSAVFLVAWQLGSTAVPLVVWILLPVALICVPIAALVVGTARSLREERRWKRLLEKRLMQGVTAAYAVSDGCWQQGQGSNPPPPEPRDGEVDATETKVASDSEAGLDSSVRSQPPPERTDAATGPGKDSGDEEARRCGPDYGAQRLVACHQRPLTWAAAAGSAASAGAPVVVPPQQSNPTGNSLCHTSAVTASSTTTPMMHHRKPAVEGRASPPLSSSSSEYVQRPSPSHICAPTCPRRATPTFTAAVEVPTGPNAPTMAASTRASLQVSRSSHTHQELPELLQRRTSWGSLRMFGLLAVEAVAAPFLLIGRRHRWRHGGVGRDDKRSDGLVGVGDRDSDAPTPAEAEPSLKSQERQPRLLALAEAVFSIMSLAPLFQSARRTPAASAAAVTARDHGSGTYSAQLAGRVSERPLQPQRASPQPLQQCTSAARGDASRGAAASPCNCPPALTPSAAVKAASPPQSVCGGGQEAPALPSSSGPQQHRRKSAFSGSLSGSRLLGLSPEGSLRASGSRALTPKVNLSSPHVCAPATLATPDEVQPLPLSHEACSPRTVYGGGGGLAALLSPLQHRRSVISLESSQRRRGSLDAEAAPGAATSEYARESAAEFIPSLYFVQYTRATLWFAKVLPRLRLANGRRRRTTTKDHAAGIRYSAEVTRRVSTSLTHLLTDAQLPWQKTPLVGETQKGNSPSSLTATSSHMSLGNTAAAASVTLPRQQDEPLSGDDAHHSDGGAPSSSRMTVLNRLQRALSRTLRCLSCDGCGNARVSGNGSGRSGGLGAVLSFAEVYIRRQACARNATKGGLEQLYTGRQWQWQRHEAARRAFWGNTTDAMLGVVDVAGSMPPWSLFCNARSPSQSAMSSLQRQYYAQLASQQRSASDDAHGGDGATMLQYRKQGNASDFVSPPACNPWRSFSLAMGSRRPPAPNPLRAAASERQAAAMVHRQECSGGMPPLPLDMGTGQLGSVSRCGRCKGGSGERRADEEDSHGCQSDSSADVDASTLTRSEADCGPTAGLACTVHWLEHWGPMLTELLYEAATDDENDAATRRRAMSHAFRGSNSSTRSSSSSADSSSRHADTQAMPCSRSTESQWQRQSQRASKGWRARLLPWRRGSTSRSPHGRGGGKSKRQRRHMGQSLDCGRQTSQRNGDSNVPPSPSMPPAFSRQPSKLLSLIAGGLSRKSSLSRSSDPFPADCPTSLQHMAVDDFIVRHSRSSSSPVSVPAVMSAAPGEGAARRRTQPQTPHHKPNGDRSKGKARVMVEKRASVDRRLSPESHRVRPTFEPGLKDSPHPPAQRHSAAAADPLIQQLRCLHLLRERLKTSYWEHLEQLAAVQRYIDYEINEAVGRVLSFLFIVLGIVSTIALVLVLCGMLRTVDRAFMSGVRRADSTVLYELAGYDSWDNFTQHCCCMAATDATARYPYYSLDVENWACTNGVTKERVRRDGYDDAIMDGYAVRELCGMEFKNKCTLVVHEGMVTLQGCSSAVSSGAALRW
ncbi:hypothetical protein LSCM1_07091 [Leishmania martiniquensis]|uniref:Uncharacterized protein n=1 Tax=Leishmania martiniquensis TaxID=1580590 RepID=A0A836H158_9TRYP|nr:hypothetical protein LSCM1_07091 [Leishmania martiniquensis]